MSTGFFDPTWRSPSLGRAASVFVLVLLLHLWALYVFSRGLSALVPADATQTTLTVSLLAPPPCAGSNRRGEKAGTAPARAQCADDHAYRCTHSSAGAARRPGAAGRPA